MGGVADRVEEVGDGVVFVVFVEGGGERNGYDVGLLRGNNEVGEHGAHGPEVVCDGSLLPGSKLEAKMLVGARCPHALTNIAAERGVENGVVCIGADLFEHGKDGVDQIRLVVRVGEFVGRFDKSGVDIGEERQETKPPEPGLAMRGAVVGCGESGGHYRVAGSSASLCSDGVERVADADLADAVLRREL